MGYFNKAVWPQLHILLPYNPVTVFLGFYPKELKSCVHTKTCPHVFIATLF